jgi:hypothetical protein
MFLLNKTSKVKSVGGYRTKGSKDKHKRCTRGFRRSKATGQCEPAQYIVKNDGPDNTLFLNDLIGDLSKNREIKKAMLSKGVAFQTLSQFTNSKLFQSHNTSDAKKNKLIEEIGSSCGDVVSSNYIEKSLQNMLFGDPDPYMDILFIKNGKQKIMGFLIAELGACRMRPQTYAINLVCSESGLGKLLVGACLYCIKFNENVATKACVLELAHAYRNTPAFFVYTRLGFNVDNSLIGDNCFHDAIQLPMSVKLTDKYSKQYFVNAMVGANFKQTDVRDSTGIYELGLPLKYSEDKGKSENIQDKMALIANIIRKMKVYSDNEKYGNPNVHLLSSDEWDYLEIMNLDIIKVEKVPITSQPRFRMYLHDHGGIKTKFIKELEKEFEEAKEEYKKSKMRVKIEK